MIESFNFEYKQTNMFHDIQPAGLSVYGERGVNGKDGLSGSTVYFINNDKINESLKSTIISRIQNSLSLDGTSQAIREYQNNDLIICEIAESVYNNVYKIVISNTSVKKYDIEKLGYISIKTNVVNVFNSIHSISLGKGPYIETQCHVPVNRSYEVSNTDDLQYSSTITSTPYHMALRTLFGFEIHPTIRLTNEDNANNYSFYLRISIKNSKSILGRNNLPMFHGFSDANTSSTGVHAEPITDTEYENIINFEKVIEIPVTKYYYNGIEDKLFGEEYNPYFISDMGCDKLHPAQNNYTSSFFDPCRNHGYLTYAIDLNLYPFHAYYFNNESSIYKIYGQNMFGERSDDALLSNILSKSSLIYNRFCDIIQYSKNPNIESADGYCSVNYRSGESAYFSGMVLNTTFPRNCFRSDMGDGHVLGFSSMANHTFDQYVGAQRSLNPVNGDAKDPVGDDTYVNRRKNLVKEYVCSKMDQFIFNDSNTFELVCIDNRTGRTKSKVYSLNQILG